MADLVFEYAKSDLFEKGLITDGGSKELAGRITSLLEEPKSEVLKQVLYELFWRVLNGTVTSNSVIKVLEECNNNEALPLALAETCWFLGLEVSHYESDEEKMMSKPWKGLCSIVSSLVDRKIVPVNVLMERLEVELLEGAGLGEAKLMQRRLVKANTNNLYRQNKYNLLREESEGYAKLITELGSMDSSNVALVRRNVQSLVGYFHLDPNRVSDIVLDAYEMDPTNSSYHELFSLFRSSNLCQIIGFKFQMYQREEVPDKAPQSLFWFSSMLIATKKLDPKQLIPHLHPSLSKMRDQYSTYLESLKAEASGIGKVSLNAAKAGASSRQAAADAKAADKAKKSAELARQARDNQHFGLIAGMLDLGLWMDAKSLMEFYGSMGIQHATDNPAVQRSLLTLVHQLVEPLYARVSPRALGFASSTKEDSEDAFPMSLPREEREIARKIARSLGRRVAAATSYFDMMKTVGPMLVKLGHRCALDVQLMFKITRLLGDLLENHPDECARSADKTAQSNATRGWLLRIVGSTLLPSLTLLPTPNPALVCSVWKVLSHFGYKARFDLYERWRSSAYEVIPELVLVKARAGYDARQVLKRMANDREMMRIAGRRFAKVSHANPLVAFSALLNNIQAYDNLIPVVVDSIKYLTPLGFDCLAYLLLTYLAKNDSKLKPDGQSHSHWLNSLCKFAGHFYFKYPQVELGGLWHYLAGQLIAKQSLDLLVLEEVVAKMTGLEVVVDFSDSMLKAMAGGPTLREQARAALGASASSRKKQSGRLLASLEQESVVMPMLILIAQQREGTIFESNTKELKLVGHLYDKGTSVLIQFSEYLATHLSLEKYTAVLPPLGELRGRFSLEPVVAFHLARPVIRHTQQLLRDAEEELFALENSSAKVPDEEISAATAKVKTLASSPWAINSPQMEQQVRGMCDEGVWKSISPTIYTLFWSLSLHDIYTPRQQYDSEIARCLARYDSLDKGEESWTPRRRAFEKQRCKENVSLLKKELAAQISHHNLVVDKLRSNKEKYFPQELNRQQAAMLFLQECVVPRVLFSAEDALFCARFVLMLHSNSVPGFSTITLFDQMARNMIPSVFSITEREAGNLSVYLHATMAQLHKWRNDKKQYAKECESKPGFATTFSDSSKRFTYTEYQEVYDRWHDKIGQVFMSALGSDNYMHMRPALLVCSKLIDVFPTNKKVAIGLKEKVQVLAKSDDRQDLQTMAKRYDALLKKKMKSGGLRELPKNAESNPPTTKDRAKEPVPKKTPSTKSQDVEMKKPKTPTTTKDSEDDGEIKEVRKSPAAASKPEVANEKPRKDPVASPPARNKAAKARSRSRSPRRGKSPASQESSGRDHGTKRENDRFRDGRANRHDRDKNNRNPPNRGNNPGRMGRERMRGRSVDRGTNRVVHKKEVEARGVKKRTRDDRNENTAMPPSKKRLGDNVARGRDDNNRRDREEKNAGRARDDIPRRGRDDHNGGRGRDDHNGGRGRDENNGGRGRDDNNGGRGRDDNNGGRGRDDNNGGRGRDDNNGGRGRDDNNGGRGRDDNSGRGRHESGGRGNRGPRDLGRGKGNQNSSREQDRKKNQNRRFR